MDFSDNPLARPKLFWANFALFLGSLACFMFMTGVKTYVLFMVFSWAALLLNYHTQKEQSQIIRKHSATMLAPAILFLGIGIMVGILNGTGMVTAMVDAVLGIVPESMARWTHVLYAILDPAAGDLHPISGLPEHEPAASGYWSRLWPELATRC